MGSLREEHIIAVTKLLWERRRKQLQLDEVDGAFYWWCCRANWSCPAQVDTRSLAIWCS